MPNDANVPQVPKSGSETLGWFKDAPGGDMNLDELFPNPGNPSTQTMAPIDPAVASQTPAVEPEAFLKTSTGTIYKNAEDAVRGTEEKDRVIAQLRSQIAAVQGQDPLKKNQAPAPQESANVSYVENPERWFKDLVTAATAGDAKAYARAQQQFMFESFAPYAPLLSEVAREKAVRMAEESQSVPVKDAHNFLGSQGYRAAMEKLPILKNAIETAESRPEMAGQLPGLYQTAYLASLGLQMPELVRTATSAPAATAVSPTARPTLTSSTPTPPAAQTAITPASREQLLFSKEGRKALIEEAKQRGLENLDWTSLGL